MSNLVIILTTLSTVIKISSVKKFNNASTQAFRMKNLEQIEITQKPRRSLHTVALVLALVPLQKFQRDFTDFPMEMPFENENGLAPLNMKFKACLIKQLSINFYTSAPIIRNFTGY